MGTNVDWPKSHLPEGKRWEMAKRRHSRWWEGLLVILTETALYSLAKPTGFLGWIICSAGNVQRCFCLSADGFVEVATP